MKVRQYNCFGDDITDTLLELTEPSRLKGRDADGHPLFDWPSSPDADKGFDKRIDMGNGSYYERIVLPPGTMLCRYGSIKGNFTSDVGMPYESLSLPYVVETIPYHEFLVITGVEVCCRVWKGKVYPLFGEGTGGGIQYWHEHGILGDLHSGAIKEVFSWRT